MQSQAPHAFSPDTEITRDHLEALFVHSEKTRAEFRIGAEAEKFGVDARTRRPLEYAGPRGVERIFDYLVSEHGWTAEAETEGGPRIALVRKGASITLEPGAQLELSGAPVEDAHQVHRELQSHLDELGPISRELGLAWLGVGFHPFATLAELPWVPKQRYGVMRVYLPERGHRALDMMQRTATVQANFDYESETDAMGKLVTMLRLSPVVHAMTANAPFIEGRVGPRLSERGDVWLHMDPARSGLIPELWSKKTPRYSDYVEWALDAGMFLFRRGERFIRNTGQTFRDFLKNVYEGHRATYGDWAQHVNSLFPEARLKRTLEVRSCDVLPMKLATAVPAIFTGLLYDDTAFDEARELAESLEYAAVEAARPEMVRSGLKARIGDKSVQALSERILDIARGGLSRRARMDGGSDETIYLAPIERLVAQGKTPADELISGLSSCDDLEEEIVRRTRLDG